MHLRIIRGLSSPASAVREMTTSLAVSVIVPARRLSDTVELLNSLLAQTLVPSEIIFCVEERDGERPVGSENIPIRILVSPPGNPASSRNAGALESTFPYLVFIDSDCVCVPTSIERIVQPLVKKDVAAVQGIDEPRDKDAWSRYLGYIHMRYLLKRSRGRLTETIDSRFFAIKRDVFFQVNGFDTTMCPAEDLDLGIRLVANGHKIVLQRSALVFHKWRRRAAEVFRWGLWYGKGQAKLARKYPWMFRHLAAQQLRTLLAFPKDLRPFAVEDPKTLILYWIWNGAILLSIELSEVAERIRPNSDASFEP